MTDIVKHKCGNPMTNLEHLQIKKQGFYCKQCDEITKKCNNVECNNINSSTAHMEPKHVYSIPCVPCQKQRFVCDTCFEYITIKTEWPHIVGSFGLEYIYECDNCGVLYDYYGKNWQDNVVEIHKWRKSCSFINNPIESYEIHENNKTIKN